MKRSPVISGLAMFLCLVMWQAGCRSEGPAEKEAATAAPPAVPAAEPAPAAAVILVEVPALGGLALSYPLNGTLFPPEAAPPTFRWEDGVSGASSWRIAVGFQDREGDLEFVSDTLQWTPPFADWEAIKRRSLEKECQVTIRGVKGPSSSDVVSAVSVRLKTSRDEVGAPIFYREVHLPFIEAIKDPSKIRWRFGSISSLEQPPVVLDNLPVCGNCHSFSADGKTLGMDVDYANDKGSYVLAPVGREIEMTADRVITWNEYKREDGKPTFGLLSQVSPSGRYVISTVKDRSVFVPRPDLAYSQLFFPIQGILVIYDRETGEFKALPGADDPSLVQSNPAWSPDGKTVVFARAKAAALESLKDDRAVLLAREEAEEYLKGHKDFKYDLYTIPFNEGEGGVATPLAGASNNGMSNFFARYSPAGKWIVFCKAKSFMLLQPDSELYIVPAGGGEARRLDCNTDRMNSWHSWSPNGKWLVFSSKQNSPYTQLFLTHIDAAGRSTPPMVLDRFTAADRAANIPEFVMAAPDAIQVMREGFLDDYSFTRAAAEAQTANDLDLARKHLETALRINPDNAKAHTSLGVLLAVDERPEEAIRHFEETIRLSPDSADGYVHLGIERVGLGDADAALGLFEKAVSVEPESASARSKLGMALLDSGRVVEALEHLRAAVRLSPQDPDHRGNLGFALAKNDQFLGAIEQLEEALKVDPKMAYVQHNLGLALVRVHRAEEALQHFAEAVELEPDDADYRNNLGMALAYAGRVDEATEQFEKALELDPESEAAKSNLELADASAVHGEGEVKELEKAVAAEPENGDAALRLAQALASRGDLAGARPYFDKAARLKPKDPLVQRDYGMALVLVDDLEGAVRQFEIAAALAPEEPLSWAALARTLSQLGRLDDALPHFREALRLSQDHPVVLNDMGQALVEGGRLKEGIEQLEKAVKGAPGFKEALDNLEAARRKAGLSQ